MQESLFVPNPPILSDKKKRSQSRIKDNLNWPRKICDEGSLVEMVLMCSNSLTTVLEQWNFAGALVHTGGRHTPKILLCTSSEIKWINLLDALRIRLQGNRVRLAADGHALSRKATWQNPPWSVELGIIMRRPELTLVANTSTRKPLCCLFTVSRVASGKQSNVCTEQESV